MKNLIILETVTFYLLLFVNISSLFYLAYMEKKENLNISESTLPIRNALIIENLKSNNIEKIKEYLEEAKFKLDIAEIINLKPYKTYL